MKNKILIRRKRRKINTHDKIFWQLCKICPTKKNVSLRDFCTIKIGGVGKYICFPKSFNQVKNLMQYIRKKKIKFFVVGNGSNVVFEDDGFSGILINVKFLNKIYAKSTTVTAFAGVNLFLLNKFCEEHNLGGLEFSYGIPATIGGAIFMNCGAFGGEIADVVKYVWVLEKNKIKKYQKNKLDFAYRHSIFMQKKDIIILKASFELFTCDKNIIRGLQKSFFDQRLKSQPYGTFNCGSVFKKLPSGGAGKIIDKLGLKGVTIGDIQISPKHANFFVNTNHAISKDLHKAIDYTKNLVYNNLGITLVEEIIFVGD